MSGEVGVCGFNETLMMAIVIVLFVSVLRILFHGGELYSHL